MNREIEGVTVGMFVGIILFAIFWGICIRPIHNDIWERNAVKNGKAEYVLNPNNGTTTWRWKP